MQSLSNPPTNHRKAFPEKTSCSFLIGKASEIAPAVKKYADKQTRAKSRNPDSGRLQSKNDIFIFCLG